MKDIRDGFLMKLCRVNVGKHGLFAVCFPPDNAGKEYDFLRNESGFGSVTFSLNTSVMGESAETILGLANGEFGMGCEVLLSNLVSKPAGWRAGQARLVRPEDM